MLGLVNARAKHLLDEAMALTTAERAELASELLASLDGEADEGAEEAWAKEIAKRAEDAVAGVGVTRDPDDVVSQIRANFRARG